MDLRGYQQLVPIGKGGMGVVFRALDKDGRQVAIKVLKTADQDLRNRFARERRLLELLGEADGFVPLLDSGESSEGPYIVMPYVPGGTLRAKLHAGGALPWEQAVVLGRGLARALAKAHERGVVHRDLKPENVLFDSNGRPLIADLGLAKHFDRRAIGGSESRDLSLSALVVGTVNYMAPEQMDDSRFVGPRADIFALGLVLYECLAGRHPFEGHTAAEVAVRARDGRIDPLVTNAPDWFVNAIMRCLARDPEERFPDAKTLREALQDPSRPRSPRLLATAAGAVLGLLIGAGAIVIRPGDAKGPGAPLAVAEAASSRPSRLDPPLPRGLRLDATLSSRAGVPVYVWALPGDAGELELVRVTAGTVLDGAEDEDAWPQEKPRRKRVVARGFWIGRVPVTHRQFGVYHAHARAAPIGPGTTSREERERPPWWDYLRGERGDHPAVMVSFAEAWAFCTWAGLELPTEAEWVRAARGDDERKYPWGDDWDPGRRCNFADASCPLGSLSVDSRPATEWIAKSGGWDQEHTDGYPYTSPVGAFPSGASPFGALDMAGDVWQWCDDWVVEEQTRASRGGSWLNARRDCRTTSRFGRPPVSRSDIVGFRVVLRER